MGNASRRVDIRTITSAAVALSAFCIAARPARFASAQLPAHDSGKIDIATKANTVVGAGLGFLPTDRSTVSVNLYPPQDFQFANGKTNVEDRPGQMLWNQSPADPLLHSVTWTGKGADPNADEPNHSVRFHGDLTASGRGSIPPQAWADVADVDIGADTLGLHRTANWTPTHSEVEDAVEDRSFGGLALPSKLVLGAFPPNLAAINNTLPKDLTVRVDTAWDSNVPHGAGPIGTYSISYPNGVAVYDDQGNLFPSGSPLPLIAALPRIANTYHILTNERFTQAGYITARYSWADGVRQTGGTASNGYTKAPVGAQDWIRVVPQGFSTFEFINQHDQPLPADVPNENDACLMVSQKVTTDGWLSAVPFDNPVANPDDRTYRLEFIGPLHLSPRPRVHVEIYRNGNGINSYDYDMEEGLIAGDYRTTQYLRLVATPSDETVGGRTTPRVQLGDQVVASLAGPAVGATVTLSVGRPASEAGSNAVRTANVRYLVLNTVNNQGANFANATNWASDIWAQCGVRFRLAGQTTITPVKNIITVPRLAMAPPGNLSITMQNDATPPVVWTFSIPIGFGNNDRTLVEKIVEKINSIGAPQFTASSFDYSPIWSLNKTRVVLVNKGHNVTFTNISFDQPGPQGQRPLTLCAGKDLCHEIEIPAATSAFHDDAFFAGMLLEQR